MTEHERAAIITAAKARGCLDCGRPIAPDEKCLVNLFKRDAQCSECSEKADRAAEDYARQRAVEETQRRLAAFDYSYTRSCVGADIIAESRVPYALFGETKGPLRFPRAWEFAVFENAEFRRRVNPTLLRACEAYDPDSHGSLVMCAKTGAGKSALARAWVWRRYQDDRKRVELGESLKCSFAWVSGFELAGARKRAALGDEAPLVQHASKVRLLVLDEVGHEPPGEEIFVVLDARYRERLPCIVTSPLEPAALMTHLGGGAYRRLLEHGALVDAFDSTRAKATVRVVR